MNVRKFPFVPATASGERRLKLAARAMLALLAVFAGTTAALAVNGRDFAGVYRYDKTADLGSQKQVTLSLRLFNHSGARVANAVVTLEGQRPVDDSYGNISGVSIDDSGSVPFGGRFTIPEAEYQRWQAGGMPHLRIEYLDIGGNHVRRPIELIRVLVGD